MKFCKYCNDGRARDCQLDEGFRHLFVCRDCGAVDGAFEIPVGSFPEISKFWRRVSEIVKGREEDREAFDAVAAEPSAIITCCRFCRSVLPWPAFWAVTENIRFDWGAVLRGETTISRRTESPEAMRRAVEKLDAILHLATNQEEN